MKPSPGIPALVLLLATSAVFAQPVYKSTMPDGKIVYGEKPVTGAKKVDRIDPPPAQTGTTTITPQEKMRAEQMAKPQIVAPPTSPERARDDAQAALKQAEAAREAGKEPLPGERLGLKGGGSRLTDDYHARQKALESAVEAARKRATETRAK